MLIHSAAQLLTLAGGPQRGRDLGRLGIIENGAVIVRDEKIVAVGSTDELRSAYKDEPTLDAGGCVVMPGGIEIHSHIAGTKVNSARSMCPEDHYDHFKVHTDCTRSGTGYTVPSSFYTGYEYSRMGYTTVFEAAVPPLEARHAARIRDEW